MDKLITKLAMSHELATALLREVERLAVQEGVGLCVVVCDEAGLLAGLARTDGARPHNVTIAQAKARTAASFGMSTALWREYSAGDHVMLTGMVGAVGDVALFGGGLPIVVDGQIVGGIGVSGPDENQDVEFATAAVADALRS